MTLLVTLAVAPASAASNYLVIIADDLGVDKISSYADDYPEYRDDPAVTHLPNTQTIDALADDGVRFTRAWANPSCSPTRASLQTGSHAFRHHIGKALDDDEAGIDPGEWSGQLLGNLFEPGLQTGYFGKWHLGTEDADGVSGLSPAGDLPAAPHPVRLGYEVFYGTITGMLAPGYSDWPLVWWTTDAYGPFSAESGEAHRSTVHATEATTAAASAWIGAQTGDWLAFVSYHAPHSAGGAPGWHYADLPAVEPPGWVGTEVCMWEVGGCLDEDLSVYRAQVEWMDQQIGVLLESIPDDVLDDTLVVFLGDNGTPDVTTDTDSTPIYVQEGLFADRGKGTVYEGGIRVPLIVADGGRWGDDAATSDVAVGITVTAPVQVLDLHRTLLIDAEIPEPTSATYDSESLWDCLGSTGGHCGRPAEFVYSEKFEVTRDVNGDVTAVTSGLAAVAWGLSDKMYVEYDEAPAVPCLRVRYYDLVAEPYEAAPAIGWTFNRRARLRDHFTAFHDDPSDWAYLLPFCT